METLVVREQIGKDFTKQNQNIQRISIQVSGKMLDENGTYQLPKAILELADVIHLDIRETVDGQTSIIDLAGIDQLTKLTSLSVTTWHQLSKPITLPKSLKQFSVTGPNVDDLINLDVPFQETMALELEALTLNRCAITSIPDMLLLLPNLKRLTLTDNKLASLHVLLIFLEQLKMLDIRKNTILSKYLQSPLSEKENETLRLIDKKAIEKMTASTKIDARLIVGYLKQKGVEVLY